MRRHDHDQRSVWIASRCAWTLYNFRLGVINATQRAGIRVTALGAGGDGFETPLLDAGVDYQEIPVDRKGVSPLADLKLFWHLYQRLQRERPTLIHLFTIKPVVYGGLASRFARVPSIITITGLGYVFTTGSPALRRITEWLYRVALRRAKTVFFQNREDRDYFVKHGIVPLNVTQLTPGSGVDIERFSPPVEPARTRPTFLMAARLIREKGVLEYIEAAKRVRQQFPSVRCILIGAPDTRNPTALTSHSIQQAVDAAGIEWPGHVSDIRSWLTVASVVVLPSYREGLPRALLEAAAMGRAIVTTDTFGCRDVVADGVNGLLVPVRDVEALTKAMLRFVGEPELANRFGCSGRQRAVREFDERYVIAQTLAAYQRAGVAVTKVKNVDEAVSVS